MNLVVPITELWVPMYLAGLKLPNGTNKSILIPPSVFSEDIKSKRWLPAEAFHSSFYSILKEKVESVLDSNSQLAQKIKASCTTQNLLVKEEANKLIKRGFNRLREKQLIENKYLDSLNDRWQNSISDLEK